ncbi:MAG TPA: SusC/RagA family TonB-linked outer membrane protein [Gemmatimonadales bacterium]|nr:SusC/RagA family TonB-linked outer membrane protein [Gemmatimonadales bacterium]
MRRLLLLCFACLLLTGTAVNAQVRTVTGRVTDAATNQPITTGQVIVRGSTVSATLGADGSFGIGVPLTDVTLYIRSVGYKSVEVRIPAGQPNPTVNVAMERDILQLDEVVVTGQATAVERRNLANAVATVDAADIAQVTMQSIEHGLQGKIAGADIQTNSGAPGGGAQFRLRGVTSINAQSEPLYVVDGVIISNVAIPSNQNAVTAASGGSNPALTQDAQVNRAADINPNDIESIEVLKGASASAIYGSKASNGVVIIQTRRGRLGAPRFDVTQRLGFFDLAKKIGSRQFETLQEAVDAFGAAAANYYTQGVSYDHEEQLAHRNDLSYETGLSVSGGNEGTRYFASGLVKHDAGIIDNTGFEKQSLRVNLDQNIGSRFSASFGTNVLHTVAARGLTNNDNTGTSFFMVFPFTPNFVDLSRNPDGTFKRNPFIESNPLQTAALMKNDEDVWRFIGTSRLSWDAVRTDQHRIQLIGNGGVDFFSQENELLFPPELQFEPADGQPGTSLLSNSTNLNFNVNGNAVYTFAPASGAFSATTSMGVQYETRDLETARIVTRNLIPGQGNIDAGTNVQVRERRERVEDFGIFFQEEVLTASDRLLLTLGARADQSSGNSDSEKLYWYPKASASYRFQFGGGMIDELKARLAYGESGNQPLFGQKFTPLAGTNNIEGLPTLVVGGAVGSTALQPERQREIEGGFDATLLDSRATLEFTIYRKNVSDLLLERQLAPSSGFNSEIFNGGKMRTSGVEVALALVPIQSRDASWLFRTTFSKTSSRITELPVPSFVTGGFGVLLGAFRIEEDSSATQIVGNDTLPGGQIIERKLGDATPDFRMSFANDFNVRGLNLYFLWDWQQGSEIINLTKLLYDFGANTADYDEDDGGQLKGAKRLGGWLNGVTANYIEDGTFLKLREVTLSYDMPISWLRGVWAGARSARLSLSGRNLLTFTPYSGHDPEVSNFGNQPIARNIDVAPFPPSRSFWFSVSLGF